MSFSKRGLKYIEGNGLSHEGQNWVINRKKLPTFRQWVQRPFLEELGTDDNGVTKAVIIGVGFTRTIWTLTLTLIGCMLYAMVYLLALKEQLDVPSSLSGFIVAVVNGVFLVAPMLWTFDEEFRIHTHPSITLALLGTLDLGPIAVFLQLLVQFAGYALGGWFVRLMAGSTTLLIDNPTDHVGLVMAFVCVTVLVFHYIYNQKFEQEGENEEDNHARTSKGLGAWLFGFTLAFYTLFKLRTYNSGLYLAAGIASGNTFVGSLPDINNGLYFTLVPLFVSTTAALLLYWLASWLAPNNERLSVWIESRKTQYRNWRSGDENESMNTEASVSQHRGAAARRRQTTTIDTGGF